MYHKSPLPHFAKSRPPSPCSGGGQQGNEPLRATHAPDKVPGVPVVVVIAVELSIATIVVQVVAIRGIVGSSGPPVAVPGIVERTIVVVPAWDSAEGSKLINMTGGGGGMFCCDRRNAFA